MNDVRLSEDRTVLNPNKPMLCGDFGPPHGFASLGDVYGANTKDYYKFHRVRFTRDGQRRIEYLKLRYGTQKARLNALIDTYLAIFGTKPFTREQVTMWAAGHELFPIPTKRHSREALIAWESRLEDIGTRMSK